MLRFFIYLFLFGSIFYFFVEWNRRQSSPQPTNISPKPNRWFRPKKNPREIWLQVYETATIEEARVLQARLQEEEVECIVYEQGKRDIHGNSLKGIGIAVPKTAAPHAQAVISRMPV